MATSGIYTIQYTRNEIIQAALRKLSSLAAGQTPTTEDYTNASVALNMLVANFRTHGMQLWKRQNYSITLTLADNSYNFGTGYDISSPYPLHILQAYAVNSDNVSTPLDIEADYDFNLLPPATTGAPKKISYQPKVNFGILKVWPTPDADAVANYTIHLVYTQPNQYFTASTDTMDFPEEWYLAIVYGLAKLLAPEWGIPLPDRQMLSGEAKEYLEQAQSFGSEDASLFVQPDRWQ